MKKSSVLWGLLPLSLASCATPPPAASLGFHNDGRPLLVIESRTGKTSQLLAPLTGPVTDDEKTFAQVKSVPVAPTAVIILEDYDEPQAGREFQQRSLSWFAWLRGLGYPHIIFLKGQNVAKPDGLPVIADYH